ncbi:TetR/AcrR family transcriptional regulator [Lysobacter solisilvae (ex Woo and Kim 2020)]|uniref:TetR/AcrR family transcriptional regulator n=1 Tax=Agrilutibacter terrestris TaxID=2865112 RepID=A0A7H0FZY6_9GAMM|nr:TetR/AcrR family transcriptional regulator [Lysobacter terrestris]QNP41602.1 TetR/AcrR family transcriptional regulator [Lysobacter terrestris]
MGTKERRQRDRAAREQRFLDCAQELIQRDGLLSLQMSRIAEDCDYAVGTLYQHFASKEDLLLALATRNCLERVDLFERAVQWPGPTRERMLAIAIADLMIIRSQPEFFRVAQYVFTDVIWHAASEPARQRLLDATAPIGKLIEGIAIDALRTGDLPPNTGLSPQTLTIGPWTLCMGMHTLVHAEGVLERHDAPEPYRLLIKNLQHLLNGYGWQPLFDVSDEAAIDAQLARISREVFESPAPPLGGAQRKSLTGSKKDG